MLIEEHAYAVLVRDVPEAGLRAGDVGVVIHVHRTPAGDAVGYMLELFGVTGTSLEEVSVPLDAVRAADPTDRASARPVAAE